MPETNLGSTLTIGRAAFLDVAPLIRALHFQPTDFEFDRGRLRHVPSRHVFRIGPKGRVTIDARCDCSGRSVSQEQGEELFQAFKNWRDQYWRAVEIDREFAAHFRDPSSLARLFRDIRTAWRRFRRQTEPITLSEHADNIVAAE